jgi:XRE family aerobic/anaerobic benzoate catabolism transcriptional regulator
MPSAQSAPTAAPRAPAAPSPAAKAAEAPLLRTLAERVREARARRGMTRRILARDSGVSERYLAQLESGQGNASVLVLEQVAQALGLPVAELLREPSPRAAELALITQFLSRLPAHRLAEVRAQLQREHGADGSQRRLRIALVGLRGAGKSTLGARLARARQVPFIELDREVEREAGTGLSEVFLLYGQAGYRRLERRALETVLDTHGACVIATGGSIVSEPATYERLLSACFTVWLRAAPEEHMARVVAQGDTRPMAGNTEAMEDLKRILDNRAALYGQADATVDTAGRTPRQSLRDLAGAVGA